MIRLYWKNASAGVVGPEHGISDAELDSAGEQVCRAHQKLMAQWQAGRLGYVKLPYRRDYRDQVMQLAAELRPGTTDLLVLGIGGSALGNIALQTALNPVTYNLLSDRKRGGPRLFVLDNIDPALVGDTLSFLGRRLKTTLVNVISKGGEAAETLGQFLIVRRMLQDKLGDDFARRIVATTDAEAGTLHDLAEAEGYETLPVPPDVGGRFSVLSPVGLFSAAMCGVDIEAMLAGAAAMKQRVEESDWLRNPAALLAAIQYLAYVNKRKPLHVMMPYSNRLVGLADWYRQLWAESLGKRATRNGVEIWTGPTPIKALGATDQHSQLQLYRQGPNDKLIVFLAAAKHPRDVRIPDAFADSPGVSYLRKARLSKLLAAEKAATEYALARSRRPSVTLRFNSITPQSVGEFFYLYEFATSLMGELLNINAYDQPAVELGKQATFALLGRGGNVKDQVAADLGQETITYEELAKQMRPFVRVDKKYLV